MLGAAAAQALALLALALAAPRVAAAGWQLRAPALALLLWQALGLAAGLLALEVAATVALSPAGATPLAALRALPVPLPWWALVAGALFLALLGRLLAVLAAALVRTASARHRHRVLVDLVATRNPLLRGTSVVDHEVPVAYCLPGLRPRVVVSRGVLSALREDEVRAVLEHELAHVAARHDLVVLPFVALGATLPWLVPVRCAGEQVALLVEVLADARAARRHGGRVLAHALAKVSGGQLPAGALGAGGSGVLVRAERLLDPPPPLSAAGRAAAVGAVAVVLALPVAGPLLPLL